MGHSPETVGTGINPLADMTLNRGDMIKLSIATSLIEAMGGESVIQAERIANAVKTISEAVHGHTED